MLRSAVFGSNGQAASKETGLHTAETAMPHSHKKSRLQLMRFATLTWQAAVKVGPRRPPARSLRLGERGAPTN